MRYSYFGVYRETNDAVSNLYAVDGSGNPVADVSPFAFGRTANNLFQSSSSLPLYQPTRNNFQPRIGAAWNIGGRNKTVLRGGYGLFNDRLYQLIFSAQGGLVNNPPFTLATSAPSVPFILREQLPLNTPIPSVTGIDPTIRDPRVHRVNATIEQSLDSATTISASFVGTYGRGLFGSEEVNGGAQAPLAARPDNRFTVQRLIGNTSSSDYSSLQIFANRRMQGGLTLPAPTPTRTSRTTTPRRSSPPSQAWSTAPPIPRPASKAATGRRAHAPRTGATPADASRTTLPSARSGTCRSDAGAASCSRPPPSPKRRWEAGASRALGVGGRATKSTFGARTPMTTRSARPAGLAERFARRSVPEQRRQNAVPRPQSQPRRSWGRPRRSLIPSPQSGAMLWPDPAFSAMISRWRSGSTSPSGQTCALRRASSTSSTTPSWPRLRLQWLAAPCSGGSPAPSSGPRRVRFSWDCGWRSENGDSHCGAFTRLC